MSAFGWRGVVWTERSGGLWSSWSEGRRRLKALPELAREAPGAFGWRGVVWTELAPEALA